VSNYHATLLRRRRFLRCALVASAGVCAGGPAVFGAIKKTYQLGVAVIGCGGAGAQYPGVAGLKENLVALADVDERKLALAARSAAAVGAAPRLYCDYRQMLDRCRGLLDAVIIATPDHHHAPAALRAMALGKHVLVQKPLAHSLGEARALRLSARSNMVVTQMANQGHGGDGYRLLSEHIWAGTIGPVREVHCLLERNLALAGARPAPEPVPGWLHWDEWLGPAPFREYHAGLHPGGWRAWTDFGTGALGDMGCHVLDGAFWALKLWQAPAYAVECLAQTAGGEGRYPRNNTVRWDFPARGPMPPVKVFSYDAEWPPFIKEIERRLEEKLRGGTVYVGEKLMMFTGPFGEGPRFLPPEEHEAQPKPPKKIDRTDNQGVLGEFLAACRGKRPASSNFEMAGPLTEIVLAGVLASRAGVGRRLEWDVEKMACLNVPEANAWVRRSGRPGWD
jgi:predicted dehydrogenase